MQIDFVVAPGSAVSDDQVEVVDADIAAFYEENSADFAHPEQVRLSYTYFPKVAGAADSQSVADEITRLREEIVAGADFAGKQRSFLTIRVRLLRAVPWARLVGVEWLSPFLTPRSHWNRGKFQDLCARALVGT